MSTPNSSKRDLTKIFLEEAKIESNEDNVKKYLIDWWATPYSPIGYRLSSNGNKFLHSTLKLTRYTYEIKEDTIKSLKLYLLMNKHLTFPYYLQGNNTIILYGEYEAMMMGLMSGDIASYLNNFSR